MIKRMRSLVVAGAILATVLVVPASPASAEPLPVLCEAAGLVNVVPSALGTTWQVSGAGSCKGDLNGTYLLNLDGVGTSDNIGLCGDSGYVSNLNLMMNVTLTNVLTLVPRTHVQRWGAAVTTFPVASPVGIFEGGSLVGGGVIFTRIFAQCPTQGTPVASFEFAFFQ